MEITEVRVTLRNEDKLKAFANITLDNEFVVRGLKIINGNNGYFVSMPSRKRTDGTHQDIAHPINNLMREKIEVAVLAAYEDELRNNAGRPVTANDDYQDSSIAPAAESAETSFDGPPEN